MNVFSTLAVLSAAVLTLVGTTSTSHAQEAYSWMYRTSGSNVDLNDGQQVQWDWAWSPGSLYMTGTVSIVRHDAGLSHAAFESFQDSLDVSQFYELYMGGYQPPTENSYMQKVGDFSGIYHFLNAGESGRGPGSGHLVDVTRGSMSTGTFTFEFDSGYSSPFNTLITLFDPGAYDEDFGTTVYTITASLNGVAVDTSLWKFTWVDPFWVDNSAIATDLVWDGAAGTLTVTGFGYEGFYPDTVAFLDTMNTSFDTLVIESSGFAMDIFAVGIGSNIPEPASSLMVIAAGAGALLLRRRYPVKA